MATLAEIKQSNKVFFEWLGDSTMEKKAADAMNDFTRTRIREDSFQERIMPSTTLSDGEIDRVYWTDKPVKIVDKEPDIPPALSVPYGATPYSHYIRGPRYMVTFSRVVSPRFTKDVSELRTWEMDIRQVISDNAIKDMMAEVDTKFISAVNTALIAQDTATPTSGSIQWKGISGGIDRDTHMESRKVMPGTIFHLEPATMLINNITIHEYRKWGRDEWGGDGSEDLLVNGWTKKRFDNMDLLVTIKSDLVPNNNVFYFADPRFIGKTWELETTTMYVKRYFFMLEWFCYRELGGDIGHTGGLVRITYT